MKNLLSAVLAAALLLTISCSPKSAPRTTENPVRPVESNWDGITKPDGSEGDMPDDTILEHEFPELEVTAQADNPDSLAPYNPSHTFEHDLLHTKIEISFDWAKRRANGRATLTMRPWFYATDRVTLDAKNFDIQSVTFDGKADPLKYDYNNEQLTVQLGRTFTRTEEFKITIAYTAKPDERESFGGSAAITSDKGLYFINPDGSEPNKPRQIWTQGETESNSFWFPTVDKPNERCTQEMYITVEDKYKTLSNGVLVSSKKNADGTRTDYWKMDKPHAPYLFMMAIGEFAVVKDKWRGIDVDYYVEPKYEPYARDIYAHTPEMLEFFSQKLDYAYPWSKYAQVTVRDYVSGAMENTTGVIFGEFMQQTKRELLEGHWTNEKVVAHEMFHHWFGDLVTTESWANLTLNEGFANYSEYLWLEHKYGRDVADFHQMQEEMGYLATAGEEGGERLVRFGYSDREAMFDAHSYNKGGAVLHMLRQLVGDEAFFTALNRYLRRHEYTDVEAHELRLAFEDVTGQDLNWFWNQWYFGAGHPVLDIVYEWDEAARQAAVVIHQIQKPSASVARVFDVPLSIDIYDASGKARRENVRLTKRDNKFVFNCPEKPALINVDASKTLLAVKYDDHTAAEWAFMFHHAPLFRDRWEALDALQKDVSASTKQVYTEALSDKFWGIRQKALERVDPTDPVAMAAVERMAGDPTEEPSVRAAALNVLGEVGDRKYLPVVQKGLGENEAPSVTSAAFGALVKIDPDGAVGAAKSLENDESEGIVVGLAELYAKKPDPAKLDWYKRQAAKIDEMAAFPFFENYQKYVVGLNDAAVLAETVGSWKSIALNPSESQWRRFSATKAVADVRNFYRSQSNTDKANELAKIIMEIKTQETDPTLLLYYDMF
ncbi:MAG: M1 family aminopeptidase [Saprospiraceae bacterium]